MFFTGIADEAGKSLDVQIRAHKELGWDHIELRVVGNANITSIPDEEFEQVVDKLTEVGMKVSCFSSELCNWARPINTDFAVDVAELNRAIPRMKRLGTPYIRIMSYPNDGRPEEDWKQEVFRRIKELARMAEDGGVTLVHENCSGWGGLSPENTLELLEKVGSPALKLVFDTGNPPAEGQDGWDFYSKVKEHIVYVHIKDALLRKSGEEAVFTFPGEGDGYVRQIVQDLLKSGYQGGMSIEPHLSAIIHLGKEASSEAKAFDTYVEYGRRFMRIIEQLQNAER
mgnify:CR=1 FL=1